MKDPKRVDVVSKSVTNHGLRDESKRNRDILKKMFLDEGKTLYSGQVRIFWLLRINTQIIIKWSGS
jgi:hypothetical protein